MNNYMKQVAELLGVGLGDPFRIEGDKADYWLDTNGLNWIEKDVHDTDDTVLVELLVGKKNIAKKPWKPKDGDGYWYVCLKYMGGDYICKYDTFSGERVVDIALLAFGNCFRTQAEAEEHKDEIIAKMREVLDSQSEYGPERTK